jgi:hypothetical protein
MCQANRTDAYKADEKLIASSEVSTPGNVEETGLPKEPGLR